MHFHVLPKRTRVCVGFVTATDFAVVRLVTGVDVRVLLPVAAVGKFSVTAVKLALERFLSLGKNKKVESVPLQKRSPCRGFPFSLTS